MADQSPGPVATYWTGQAGIPTPGQPLSAPSSSSRGTLTMAEARSLMA